MVGPHRSRPSALHLELVLLAHGCRRVKKTAAGSQICWRPHVCRIRTSYANVRLGASYVQSVCHKLVHRGGASVWYSRQRAQPPGRLRKPTLAGTHSLSSQMGDASAAQAIVRCDATCTLQPPAPRKCREAAAVPAPPPPQRGAAYESCDAALDYGCLAQRTMGRRAVAAAPCTLGLAG